MLPPRTYQPDHLSGILLAYAMGNLILRGFMLRCFQHLSLPHIATQLCPAEQLVHQRCVHPGPLVLRTAPLKFPTPTTDRDRTVSRRSEPSSRTALMGEQPNRGQTTAPGCDEPTSRCQTSPSMWTLGEISLLSRGSFYPLSDGPSMRNHRITKPDFRPCSTCRSRSQAPLCLCTLRMISNHSGEPLGASVTL